MPIFAQLPVFQLYATLVLGVLLSAGIVLAILTFGFRRSLRSIWLTYASWWGLTLLAFGAIYAGRIPTILLFTLFAILGFKEFARATGLYRDWWMTGGGYLAILAACLAAIVPNPRTGAPGWLGLYLALPAYAIALFVLIPVLRNRFAGQIQAIALSILGFICIGWMFLHLALLADRPHAAAYLLFLLVAVALSDVAAFVFGRVLGQSRRHLLRSQISPNKTWEGALGALVVSLALPWLLRFSFPHFGMLQLSLTGLIIGVGGQLGDLSISLIKRDLGLKDMGTLLPGHGGVLDRMDSLIYTAPWFFHLVNFCDV